MMRAWEIILPSCTQTHTFACGVCVYVRVCVCVCVCVCVYAHTHMHTCYNTINTFLYKTFCLSNQSYCSHLLIQNPCQCDHRLTSWWWRWKPCLRCARNAWHTLCVRSAWEWRRRPKTREWSTSWNCSLHTCLRTSSLRRSVGICVSSFSFLLVHCKKRQQCEGNGGVRLCEWRAGLVCMLGAKLFLTQSIWEE